MTANNSDVLDREECPGSHYSTHSFRSRGVRIFVEFKNKQHFFFKKVNDDIRRTSSVKLFPFLLSFFRSVGKSK